MLDVKYLITITLQLSGLLRICPDCHGVRRIFVDVLPSHIYLSNASFFGKSNRCLSNLNKLKHPVITSLLPSITTPRDNEQSENMTCALAIPKSQHTCQVDHMEYSMLILIVLDSQGSEMTPPFLNSHFHIHLFIQYIFIARILLTEQMERRSVESILLKNGFHFKYHLLSNYVYSAMYSLVNWHSLCCPRPLVKHGKGWGFSITHVLLL